MTSTTARPSWIAARALAAAGAGVLTLVVACGGTPTGGAGGGASGPAPSAAAATPSAGGMGTPPAATARPGTATASPAAAEPVASTASIATAALPKATFTAAGGSAVLPVEAPPEREYMIGLSGRTSLDGRGMLFAFPDGSTVGFWMKGTHIDLDIAFVDASMQVIDVRTMRADTLDVHTPPARYVAAVEAPAGWYAGHGVRVGSRVAFDIDLRAAAGR